jgi:hypothetical protein
MLEHAGHLLEAQEAFLHVQKLLRRDDAPPGSGGGGASAPPQPLLEHLTARLRRDAPPQQARRPRRFD